MNDQSEDMANSDDADDEVSSASSRMVDDRRAFLTKAAIGGAAAWVVPSVLSVQAAAAATCSNQVVINWSDWISSIPNLNPPGPGSFDIGIGSSSLCTVSFSDAGMTSGGTAQAVYASTTPLGARPDNFIEVSVDSVADGESCELTFAFTGTALTQVQNLTFQLLDVDRGIGFWQDQVELTASLAGSPVLATSVTTGPYTNHTVFGSSDFVTGNPDPSGTGAGTPNTTTDANATVTYGPSIDKLVLRYTALNGNALQQIGIYFFEFCLIE